MLSLLIFLSSVKMRASDGTTWVVFYRTVELSTDMSIVIILLLNLKFFDKLNKKLTAPKFSNCQAFENN